MKILVAHDGSEHADKALGEAAKIASGLGGSVGIVSVVPDLCLSSEEIGAQECDVVSGALLAETKGRMQKVVDGLAAKGVQVELVIKEGRPVDVILETAEAMGADLLVVGSRGRHGARRFLLGSVSTKVAEHATMNILIVK